MKISDLLKGLEYQKKIYGDIDVELDTSKKFKKSEIHFVTHIEEEETSLTLSNYPTDLYDPDEDEKW